LKQQLEGIVVQELNANQKRTPRKRNSKAARANRKRLPKRDPMTAQIYKELIKEAEGPTYLNARLRLALCLLAVTGIRINELLNIKVSDLLQHLIQEDWIAIDRSKRGPSNHKAFLTKEGKKIIQDRKKDFELIFLMKELDAYLFTSESDHFKKLRREAITRDVNKVMRLVSKQLPGQPNLTSHSFRIGYITQLWKDSKDIEFVKQTIGHRKLYTTSAYVNQLSDQERQKRIEKL
jgi:integrase